MGVLKESSWNFQQVGVLRVDASSPTDMLRQMCQELVTSDRERGNCLVSPYLTAMLPSFIILVINRVQYSHA